MSRLARTQNERMASKVRAANAPPTRATSLGDRKADQMAKDWAVPTSFLEGLVATEPPREYLRANAQVLTEAATIRFLRELR